MTDNNKVIIIGKCITNFIYDHQTSDVRFYTLDLEIERISGTKDIIPILLPEEAIDSHESYIGKYIQVNGQYRSHRLFKDNVKHTLLRVHAKSIKFVDVTTYLQYAKEPYALNQIFLNGIIEQAPVYRKTPYGKDVTDIILKVRRSYEKHDFIPCLAWGSVARFASTLQPGTPCWICGRIQSREYTKIMPDNTSVIKTAYEVSAYRLNIEEENNQNK